MTGSTLGSFGRDCDMTLYQVSFNFTTTDDDPNHNHDLPWNMRLWRNAVPHRCSPRLVFGRVHQRRCERHRTRDAQHPREGCRMRLEGKHLSYACLGQAIYHTKSTAHTCRFDGRLDGHHNQPTTPRRRCLAHVEHRQPSHEGLLKPEKALILFL